MVFHIVCSLLGPEDTLARTFSAPVTTWHPAAVKGLVSGYSQIFSEAPGIRGESMRNPHVLLVVTWSQLHSAAKDLWAPGDVLLLTYAYILQRR